MNEASTSRVRIGDGGAVEVRDDPDGPRKGFLRLLAADRLYGLGALHRSRLMTERLAKKRGAQAAALDAGAAGRNMIEGRTSFWPVLSLKLENWTYRRFIPLLLH